MKKLIVFLLMINSLLLGQQLTSYSISSDGFITSWLIRGGFQVDDQRTRDFDFLNGSGGEFRIFDPVNIMKTEIEPGSKASSSKWISVNTNSRVVSFLEFLGSSPSKACYALTFIESDKTMPVILKCGSDDGIKIILNGKLIHNNNVWRGVVPDDDIVRCELKKGINSVLVKINNGSGDFGFCMKTLSSDGLPAGNIKVMLPNSFSNDEIFKSIYSSFNIYTTYDKTDGSAKFLALIASESCYPLNSKDKFHLKLALIDRKGKEIDTFYNELLSGIGNFKSKEIICKPKSLSPGRYVIRLSVFDEKENLLSGKENIVFWN